LADLKLGPLVEETILANCNHIFDIKLVQIQSQVSSKMPAQKTYAFIDESDLAPRAQTGKTLKNVLVSLASVSIIAVSSIWIYNQFNTSAPAAGESVSIGHTNVTSKASVEAPAFILLKKGIPCKFCLI
jgi:hypothetical protein